MRSITLSIKFNVPVGCRWFWPSGYLPDWLRDGALSPRVAGADQWHAALHHVRASPNAPWLSGCERCLWEITQRDWMKSRQRFSRAINGDGDIEPKCIIQHLKAKAHFALSSLCCGLIFHTAADKPGKHIRTCRCYAQQMGLNNRGCDGHHVGLCEKVV